MQNRLVRLLGYVLKLDPASAHGRDALDGILRCAWDDLTRVGLLQVASTGRYLALEDMAFSPSQQGMGMPSNTARTGRNLERCDALSSQNGAYG